MPTSRTLALRHDSRAQVMLKRNHPTSMGATHLAFYFSLKGALSKLSLRPLVHIYSTSLDC